MDYSGGKFRREEDRFVFGHSYLVGAIVMSTFTLSGFIIAFYCFRTEQIAAFIFVLILTLLFGLASIPSYWKGAKEGKVVVDWGVGKTSLILRKGNSLSTEELAWEHVESFLLCEEYRPYGRSMANYVFIKVKELPKQEGLSSKLYAKSDDLSQLAISKNVLRERSQGIKQSDLVKELKAVVPKHIKIHCLKKADKEQVKKILEIK